MGMLHEMRRLSDRIDEAQTDLRSVRAAVEELTASPTFAQLPADGQMLLAMVADKLDSIRSTLAETDESITG